MKILAGRFKGIPIKMSIKMPYRPTKSRVRKSIFDKLIPLAIAIEDRNPEKLPGP